MIIKSIKAKADAQRSTLEKIADWLTSKFGSIAFLLLNVAWFIVWIVLNLGFNPKVKPFDPFPFGLLTMIVSLEAIILSVIVLVSQNREEKVNSLREEADLQVDIVTEEEITKILELVTKLCQHSGVDVSSDKTLQEMLKPTNVEKIEKHLENQMNKK